MSKPVVTPWHWNFPPIAEPLPMGKQIRSVALEVREAYEAYVEGEGSERVAEELMDVIHRAETALRAIESGFVDLDGVKHSVIEKNAERGYYGEDGVE